MSPRRKKSTLEIDLTSLVEPIQIQIRTQRYGTLRLKTLSLGDMGYVEELLRTDPPAREFTVQLVQHQLIEPELTIEIVQGWPDKLLLRVARLWAKNESVLDQNLLEEEKISFDTFKQVFADYITEQQRKIRDLIGGFSDYADRMAFSISSIVSSTMFQSITENFLHMTAFNVRLAGLETLPKMLFFENPMKQFYENIGQLAKQSLLTQFKQLGQIIIPEPFLSDTMVLSGLNSPLVHTPTYIFPKIEPVRKKEELQRRAEDAVQRRLVDAYDILSQLELSLRNLIEIKLREMYGDRWWKRGVPETVQRDCEERKRREEKPFEAGYHPIHYAYLGHCKDIVMRGDNWKAGFSAVFGKRTEFEVFIDWVQKVRLPIGHPRTITDDDYLYFTASARWLQTAIDRAISQGPL